MEHVQKNILTVVNQIFSYFFVVIVLFFMATPATFAFSGTGAGTTLSPFLITSCPQLAEVNDDKTATYRLEQNLDCTSSGNTIIIGGLNSFDGTFLGNNKSITIVITNIGEDYQGLFTHTSGATISDLTVHGTVSGTEYVGGLVGYSYNSTITNVKVTANITATGDYIGGIVGDSTDTTWENIRSTGNVTGDDYIGGVIGVMYSGSITDSWASGNISGVGNIGGFVGQTYSNAVIEKSYSTGTVTGSGWEVGGFIGDADSVTINQSFATGSVNGGGYTGGFVGNTESAVIENAYARGSVTSDGEYVGGFVGSMNDNSITNAYSTGSVVDIPFSGGFTGEFSLGTIVNSFWDTQTSGRPTSLGDETGKTTAEMKSLATFTTQLDPSGWNFNTIWDIDPTKNDGYPFFRWQSFPTLESTTQSNTLSTNYSSPSVPQCTEQSSQPAPDLFEFKSSSTSTTLFFTPLLHTSQYFISYSTEPNAEEHGTLVNLSSEGVQSFKIDSLTPNTQYYFKVRGQYGCAAGEWSAIKKTNTTPKLTNKIDQATIVKPNLTLETILSGLSNADNSKLSESLPTEQAEVVTSNPQLKETKQNPITTFFRKIIEAIRNSIT